MTKNIILEPATRIEGNANIHIEIDAGQVKKARFMVHDFRGFEKIVSGKRVEFVPHIVSRICGLCSNAHQVAGFQAIEEALGITPPESVTGLRKIAVFAEWISSHALSYFFLSSPGLEGSPQNIFELMQLYPEYADDAFRLRKLGNRILEIIGKRAIHPVTMGVGCFKDAPDRSKLAAIRKSAQEIKQLSGRLIEQISQHYFDMNIISFPEGQKLNFISLDYAKTGKLFSVFDRNGMKTHDFITTDFEHNISELRVDWSLAKFPYITDLGFPDGILLVGPLSRIYQKDSILTDTEILSFPMADKLKNSDSICLNHFDICRILEIFWAAKKILLLLDTLNPDDFGTVPTNLRGSGKGVGVVEAPRGVLVHSYLVKKGKIDRMRLLVATQFNNAYINLIMRGIAENNIGSANSLSAEGEKLIGQSIRTFDPCLTCATH